MGRRLSALTILAENLSSFPITNMGGSQPCLTIVSGDPVSSSSAVSIVRRPTYEQNTKLLSLKNYFYNLPIHFPLLMTGNYRILGYLHGLILLFRSVLFCRPCFVTAKVES